MSIASDAGRTRPGDAVGHTTLAPDEERAWRAYQRMQARLGQHLARELAQETGLSDADYDVLHALGDAPDGRLRAIELRLAVEWEKSRLSHQLRRMEQRGLVTREACSDDLRSWDVVLTDEGRDAVTRARCARVRSIHRHVLDRLTPDQVAALTDIADTLNAGLDTACSVAPERLAALAEAADLDSPGR
ncbi:MarR family winged helix-turn-helix transcriptional regulator [Oerskovia flava]|uniref:MarR family winged helix-turn-helix transcriptional regulator n=1 Tax=Oerskovia flava TaxID=2986422 RepID=UPI00223EABA4|nr:MarR family transcriptional regulator [Oerskovia sp. JB1-3-2]